MLPEFLSTKEGKMGVVTQEEADPGVRAAGGPDNSTDGLDDQFEVFRLPRPYSIRVNHGLVGQVQRLLYTLFGP